MSPVGPDPADDPEPVQGSSHEQELAQRLEIDRPDDPVPTPEDIVSLARRFHRQLRVALNLAVEGVGLSYAAIEVLEVVHRDPNQHAASVAAELWSSRQAVSRLVVRLVDGGLLRRLPIDHGVHGLALTDDGRRVLAEARELLAGFHEMLVYRLPEEGRWKVFAGLNLVEAAIRPSLM